MYIRLEAISLKMELMINERIFILHFVQEMYSIEEALGVAIVPFNKNQSCASLLEIQSKLLTKFDNSQHQVMVEKPINYLEHRYCSERINLRDGSSILAKA